MNSNNQSVILVVDDISSNLVLMKAFLKLRDCEVLTAASGDEALKIAGEVKPDVVLLDIMMPKMDGFEVLARLRGNPATKDVKVLMVSALSSTMDIKNAMDLGADGFIAKPIVASKLYEELDRVLG
ncbi:MAG: response regulator [Bacteroidales bacterium]|nr:response regulator [Bacteroidales bacterium]